MHTNNTQWKYSVQFSSVTQSCPTLCDPMNRGRPGLPVHHHLLEFTQTQVHRDDAIQPSRPLSSPSPPAPNPSQHQGFFQLVNSSQEVAKVLELYYQAINKKDILLPVTKWMNLEGATPSEISQIEKDKYCMTSLLCGIQKTKPIENRLVVAGGVSRGLWVKWVKEVKKYSGRE